MIDLSTLTPALLTSPITPNLASEAPETGEFAGIDFARLLGLQLGAAPQLQGRAAAVGGKEGPASGNILPETDTDLSMPDAPVGEEAVPLDAVHLPAIVASPLPFTQVSPDPLQPVEHPVGKGAPVPQLPSPVTPRDPVAAPALPIHAAPRAAEALAARLDLRFEAPRPELPGQPAPRAAEALAARLDLRSEAPRPELPGQAAARAVEVHAARLAGLRPGPASPEAGAAGPSPANPAATRAEPAIAPIARGPMPDAAPQGRPGKAQKEQATAPQVALSAAVGEPAAPVLAAPAASTMTPNPPITATSAPEAPRADFATLVDRLAEARDAAGAEPVRLALRHAEFGQIALHIRSDDSGLSVTMASPDPDFARAVSAAVPATSGAQGGDVLPQSDSGQPRQSGGSAAGEGSAQSRQGSGPERRHDEPRPRPNQSATPREEPGERRGGIFA